MSEDDVGVLLLSLVWCLNSEWYAKACHAFHKECDTLNETVNSMRCKDVLRSHAKLRAEAAAISETVRL
jgi:hypothetical protein